METDFTPLITWESTNHGFSQLRTLRGKNRKRLRAMASCGARAENPLPSDLLDWSFGGYSCSFLEEPDQTLLCLICSRVLREPELTDCCGNHYCASCLKRWLNSSRSCPLCRENDFSTLRDKKTERVVQSLQVSFNSIGSRQVFKLFLCATSVQTILLCRCSGVQTIQLL